jgi:phospholipid/cholesterol/gamma-HCH transport system permease protein
MLESGRAAPDARATVPAPRMATAREYSLGILRNAGHAATLFVSALRYTPNIPFRWKLVVREMWIIGVQSLPLACFFLFLIGMVFALQTGIQLEEFGQESLVGRLVSAGMARELGPWMTAFVLVARNGSSMAAEIGTMSVSEEVSALKMMSINPADFVVMPRLVGFVLMGPVVTVIATACGILGGMVVSVIQLQTPSHVYLQEAREGLSPPMMLYWAVGKSLVFGAIAATVACSYGLRTRGGALGVGKASRDTVVVSLVLVVFFNYVLTSFYLFVDKLLNAA